jgi:hypothetical protein
MRVESFDVKDGTIKMVELYCSWHLILSTNGKTTSGQTLTVNVSIANQAWVITKKTELQANKDMLPNCRDSTKIRPSFNRNTNASNYCTQSKECWDYNRRLIDPSYKS